MQESLSWSDPRTLKYAVWYLWKIFLVLLKLVGMLLLCASLALTYLMIFFSAFCLTAMLMIPLL